MKVSRFFIFSLVLFVMVLVFSIQAHAQLEFLGQGTSTHGTYNLIYDTDLDVTWYDYTSQGNWQNHMDWAGALSVTFGTNTYTDWRLPTTVDGPWVEGYDGTTTAGWNITTSEMGHLFYTELGNEGNFDTDGISTGCYNGAIPPMCLTNTGDFQNLQPGKYWSGTEYADNPTNAWDFFTQTGQQTTNLKVNAWYGIAVLDGRAVATVVPEPISSVLFIVGGATLGFRRFRKKFKK